MWRKLGGFFKGFFRNIVADPASTVKGLVSLASAGATCYGMATGKVPVNELSVGAASALVTNGIHALGTDATTGKLDPVAEAAVTFVNTAAAVTPQALSVADHYEAIRQEHGKAQAIIAAVSEGATALASTKPPEIPADISAGQTGA